jgi:hypothetical protein
MSRHSGEDYRGAAFAAEIEYNTKESLPPQGAFSAPFFALSENHHAVRE